MSTEATGSDLRSTTDLPAPGPHRAAYWLSGALALVSLVAAALTFWVPGILTGPAVMNGSARGTALVVMLLAVPVTVASMAMTARGSVRALVVWLGALAYLAYNSVMFVFATPFNRLFLVYVAMLSLSVWTLVSLLPRTDPSSIVTERLFARTIAVSIWVVVALNALAWMRVVVPALFADRPGRFLDGSGLPTNPVFVQDLAVWLPAMTLAALWLWRGQPRGVLLVGAGLVFWCVEAVGIAVDQWFGSRAAPSSDVASMSVVPVFATLAAVGVVPIWLHLRAVRGRAEPD